MPSDGSPPFWFLGRWTGHFAVLGVLFLGDGYWSVWGVDDFMGFIVLIVKIGGQDGSIGYGMILYRSFDEQVQKLRWFVCNGSRI